MSAPSTCSSPCRRPRITAPTSSTTTATATSTATTRRTASRRSSACRARRRSASRALPLNCTANHNDPVSPRRRPRLPRWLLLRVLRPDGGRLRAERGLLRGPRHLGARRLACRRASWTATAAPASPASTRASPGASARSARRRTAQPEGRRQQRPRRLPGLRHLPVEPRLRARAARPPATPARRTPSASPTRTTPSACTLARLHRRLLLAVLQHDARRLRQRRSVCTFEGPGRVAGLPARRALTATQCPSRHQLPRFRLRTRKACLLRSTMMNDVFSCPGASCPRRAVHAVADRLPRAVNNGNTSSTGRARAAPAAGAARRATAATRRRQQQRRHQHRRRPSTTAATRRASSAHPAGRTTTSTTTASRPTRATATTATPT